MSNKSEFTIQNTYQYDRTSTARWVWSHVWRHKRYLFQALGFYTVSLVCYSLAPVLTGRAAEEMLKPGGGLLLYFALGVMGVLMLDGFANVTAAYSAENVGKRFQADARQELYEALLGKSQTFHNRQRVGDLMARATDDTSTLSDMIIPGSSLIMESTLAIIIPFIYIGVIQLELLTVPVLFILCHAVALRAYVRQLQPVTERERMLFGQMNAGLEESISGIEVVKASSQENFERSKYQRQATASRDTFVRRGYVEARYLPLLLFAIAAGLQFLHGLWLYQRGLVSIAEIIAVVGLMEVLRFPTFISIFTFSLVQSGLAGAKRILTIIRSETEVDENAAGHDAPMRGEIVFEAVSFGYEDRPLLHNVSFRVAPGQTVAIVGQTGSGKSSLTQLVNRTYDATAGRVLIDGVDVRRWSLDALRSQIGKIEQDIFLFSRTIAENIAFGKPTATQTEIEDAAKAAQAHDFILSFKDGYNTVVGERGVTLSGGQRQRLALARAFLSDPRILILDDATSAIDSATEDEIQRAMRRIQHGRTTLLITHRLSQIRWADTILVLDQGQLVASGAHETLLRHSLHYRRIFARYDMALPQLEAATS
ncbi:MAG: ABC transporter ATP-binding protein [Anaerolineales bacterium]